jgi:4-azaleucine resistance transporter AzlC
MRHARLAEFAAGVRAEAPLLLGVAPFGMAYGAYAVENGVSAALAQGMSAIIFGGASQFAAVQAFAAGAPAIALIATVALVNLRHLLYGAALAPHVQQVHRGWRALLAYLLTDEAYAVGIARYADAGGARRNPTHAHWYVLGAGVALWACWQATTALGVLIGQTVPESWSLDFALPVTFIAVLVPALDGRGALAAVFLAGVIAVAGHSWPYQTALVSAAVAGMAGALVAERLFGNAAKSPEAA